MNNIVNIDLTNNSCWGATNIAGSDNEINLCIKLLPELLDKTDIQLEFTKPDGVIITTENLAVDKELINYELLFSLYVTKGTLKLRILATGYTSDYINFNINDNYTETDDICVKFDSSTKEFNINKCKSALSPEVPAGGTTGQVLEKNSNIDYDTKWVDIPTNKWIRLSDETNIDNLTSNGYYALFNATGTLPPGFTTDNNFFLRNSVWSSNYSVQEFFDIRSNGHYVRNKRGGVWNNWVNLSDKNILTLGLTDHYTTTTTTEYEILPLNKNLFSIGSKLTLTEDGGVKIGSGINNVRVSGNIYFRSGSQSNDMLEGAIRKNNNSTAIDVLQRAVTAGATSITLPSKSISVNEGDVIYLTVRNQTRIGQQVGAFDGHTFLNVEEIN